LTALALYDDKRLKILGRATWYREMYQLWRIRSKDRKPGFEDCPLFALWSPKAAHHAHVETTLMAWRGSLAFASIDLRKRVAVRVVAANAAESL
jgi:hypothetical protein